MTVAEAPRHARDMNERERRVALEKLRNADAVAREAAEHARFMGRLRRKYPDIAARASAAERES